MDHDRAIEAFLMAASCRSFSGAAARLGITAAAVSRQVATLEADLGVRLFHRTTRCISLTESGELLQARVDEPWQAFRAALAAMRESGGEPKGRLRVSVGAAFGIHQLVPRMGDFLARYPGIDLDWSFENRRVQLIEEGFDAAIGTGIDPHSRVVARPICPIDGIACASPALLERTGLPQQPGDLERHDLIRMRSAITGRLLDWAMECEGERHVVNAPARLVFTELDAIRGAACAGLGFALLGVHHVVDDLESGRLVRVLPGWQAPRLWISVYYPSREWVEPKVRVFVDYLAAVFEHPDFRDPMSRWLDPDSS